FDVVSKQEPYQNFKTFIHLSLFSKEMRKDHSIRILPARAENPTTINTMGLDKESIEALPITKYKSKSFKGGLECAVCLSEFQEDEKFK
ncbi:hypothetical protein KI387_000583, partial [Taxus chinensis]